VYYEEEIECLTIFSDNIMLHVYLKCVSQF